MPTENGKRIVEILQGKITADEEAAKRREELEADVWAQGRIKGLIDECRECALGTTIELVHLEHRKPSRAESAMIKALGRELGVALDGVEIQSALHGDEPGAKRFVLSLQLRELLAMLKKSEISLRASAAKNMLVLPFGCVSF